MIIINESSVQLTNCSFESKVQKDLHPSLAQTYEYKVRFITVLRLFSIRYPTLKCITDYYCDFGCYVKFNKHVYIIHLIDILFRSGDVCSATLKSLCKVRRILDLVHHEFYRLDYIATSYCFIKTFNSNNDPI